MGTAVGTARKLAAFLRLLLTLLPVEYIRQNVACLLLAVLDDMAVDVFGRRDLRVAEHLGDCHDIRTVHNHHRGSGVPESVRVDIRKPAAPRKLIQPLGDAVRVHRLPVILLEDIVILLP